MKSNPIINWTLQTDGIGQMHCTLPASVYSVLYDSGKIEDPHQCKSFDEFISIAEKDCLFSASFPITAKQTGAKFLALQLEGLDTVCDVCINGKHMLHTENLFRTYEIDLKNAVIVGDNSLEITIRSPLRYVQEKQSRKYVWGQTCEVNDTNVTLDGIAQIQKPSYMFGWDWAPQMPDMGIYGSCCVLFGENRITDTCVRQSVGEGSALLRVSAAAQSAGDSFSAELTDMDGTVLSTAIFTDETVFKIADPKLWWPNGMGGQPLYRVTIRLLRGAVVLDEISKNIGIRTLTVAREKDDYGREFCFCINGKKIFAMGANYVPHANPVPWMTENKLKALLKDCAEANFNCIRVWGGGFYASDCFYDLCDRLGLIVWQDFMFACRNVYLSEEFISNVSGEVKENLLRVRHHASLGLLCGNNEMEQGVFMDPSVGTSVMKQDYIAFYEHLLPDLTRRYAPDTFYWPSSPSSGDSGHEIFSDNDGDCHFWETWYAGKPFEVYREHYFRFCSEYGFESYPSVKTIDAFCPPEEKNAFSPTMDHHQRCLGGNVKIISYLSDKFRYPEKLEDLVYASQVIQGEAIRYGVEHFRRNRHRCKGSLYWQLNDCWPAVSWSSIDYFGRWKALHYMAKRFHAPVLLSAMDEKDRIVFNVSNELLTPFSGDAEFIVATADFKVLESYPVAVAVESLHAENVFTLNLKQYDKKAVFVGYRLLQNGKRITDEALLFVKPKQFGFIKPHISFKLTGRGRRYQLTLRSDVFTQYVQVECDTADIRLSDNYFSLTDGSEKTISLSVDGEMERDKLYEALKIKTVWDLAGKK